MSRPPKLKNKAIILGVKIDDQPLAWVLEKIEYYLHSDKQCKIFTPNPEICLKASTNEKYTEILNKAEINIPDGFGLKLGAQILEETLKNRLAGSDLTKIILQKYNNGQHKFYIVLRNDSLSTAEDIKKLSAKQYPQIEFKTSLIDVKNIDECDETLNEINQFQPQFLFVAIGAPAQEIWISKFIKFLPSVKIAMGIGGSFDFLTGRIKRAPLIMRKLGMEWFYRLYQEPSRLKRIKNATADFLFACHEWKKRIKTKMRPNVLAVIRNQDGKYLVQKNKRFYNHWQFPQGGVDNNEDPAHAVIREAGEELGVPVQFFKVIQQIPKQHQYIWPQYAQLLRGYKGQSQIAFILEFSGKDQNFNLQDSEEVAAIKWVDKNDLLKWIHPQRQEFAKIIIKYL